jgi:hypothetical protein
LAKCKKSDWNSNSIQWLRFNTQFSINIGSYPATTIADNRD